MALPRPYWKGYLKLSLVSCPIAVYTASSSSERIAFRQINKKTGNRLRQQYVDEETGAVVESGDKGRGFEVAKGEYLPIDDADYDAIAIESTQTIEIDSFVPRNQIDERYLESPYYIAPEGKVGLEAFGVIREAMRGKDMVALGRVVMGRRERVIMLQAWEQGLLGETLRYAYEVRDAATYFGDIAAIDVPKDLRQLAEHILDSKATDFDPSTFRDRYEEAVVAMVKTKQEGSLKSVAKPAAAKGGNVVDLMSALRASLGEVGKPAERLAAKGAKAKKRRSSEQREMLLPIGGNSDKDRSAPAKTAASPAKAAAGPVKKAPRATSSRKTG